MTHQKFKKTACTLSSLRLLCTIITFCSVTVSSYSQDKYRVLEKSILTADTIILINYSYYEHSATVQNKIHNGEVDFSIVKKGKRLDRPLKVELAKILGRVDVVKGRRAVLGSFYPHETILLWHGTRFSYIEICLACMKVISSPDMGIDELNIESKKEEDIRDFFKKNRLKTKL